METAEHFAVRRSSSPRRCAASMPERRRRTNKLTEAAVDKRKLDAQAAEVNAELAACASAQNNIPSARLELRAQLCRDLRLTENALPFAGELIAVRQEESDWEGAAERLLHGFALSMLVPDGHYHCGVRLDQRAAPASARGLRPGTGAGRRGSRRRSSAAPRWPPARGQGHRVRADWLERELPSGPTLSRRDDGASSAGHRAVTKAGQIKGGVRHEKDDRFRIDDRSRYVLGWSNERKIDALLDRAAELAGQLAEAERTRPACASATGRRSRGQCWRPGRLADFGEIDYQSAVTDRRPAEEHAKLKAASAELARLDAALGEVEQQIGR